MVAALWLAGEALLPSRIQMAFTLASHILLVPLGVSMPTLTLLMEGIGIWRKDPIALKIARRWSVVMAVQFAVGAVTGTILSFEFGILWPRMMGRFGAAFGLGFAIEGLAFFVEAIFISIYLYGWRRLSPRAHFLTGLALPPAGLLGAFGVLSANCPRARWCRTSPPSSPRWRSHGPRATTTLRSLVACSTALAPSTSESSCRRSTRSWSATRRTR